MYVCVLKRACTCACDVCNAMHAYMQACIAIGVCKSCMHGCLDICDTHAAVECTIASCGAMQACMYAMSCIDVL